MTHTHRWLLLTAVLLAAFFRFWQLDTMPPGLYHDEAYNGLDALSLSKGVIFPQFYEGWELYAQDAHAERPPNETRFPIFFEGNYGREPLHVYLMALSVSLFGATPFAIRAVPATAGVLAIVTTYFASAMLVKDPAWEKSDRWRHVPLFAAFALAILYPAIHFSRFGIRAMLFVPIETLTVGLFWYGINRLEGWRSELELEGTENRQSSIVNCQLSPNRSITQSLNHSITITLAFALAGIFLGLGIYTYAAARLFPLLFILFIPLWLWHSKQWQNYAKYAALMAGASILTALPLLIFFFRYPYFFVFRIAFVSNKGTGTVDGRPWLTWLLNIGRVVRGLIWQGETHLRHNLPGRPYLDPIQLAFFGTGIAAYFYRWNRLRPIFLGLWLVVMLLPTILSGDAPHFGRMTGAAPVVAILIGIGAAWGYEKIVSGVRYQVSGGQVAGEADSFLFSLFSLLSSRNFLLFTFYFSLFTASAFLTYRDYFTRYANHPQVEADFYLPDWELGLHAAAQPDDAMLYLTPTQEEMATIYYALADPERMRSYAGGNGLVPLGKPNGEAVYFIRPVDDNRALAQLEAVQDDAVELVELDGVFAANGRFPTTTFADYQTISHQWGNQIRLDRFLVERQDGAIGVHFLWQALGEMERPFTAFVHLIDENGEIVTQQDRPPAGYPTTDWQPDELIYDRYVVALPDSLVNGRYRLRTGFYDSATLQPLGEPLILQELTLGE